MLNRRDVLKLALVAPWLAACGGSGSPGHGSEQPIQTHTGADDWASDSPASQGMSAAVLQAFLDEGASHPFLFGALVVRNGKLIGERYYNGAQSSDLRSVASVTKTVGSLLIGQALAEGKIASTAATLAMLLPAELARTPNPYAADITLQQLLDMSGGQQWNEAARQRDATNAPDMTAFALALPAGGQGKTFNYTTASSHLVSPILQRAYGMDELAIATANLFGPLGIKDSAWSRDATGMVHGSFGLQLRTRDLMKLAWMAMQGGQWQGRTVVPAAWIRNSLTPTIAGIGDEAAMSLVGYHNLWWAGSIAGLQVHAAMGYGGQFAFLVPELNLAIATNAELNVDYATAGEQQGVIINMIGRFLRAAQS